MRPIDADALIEKCGGWYVEEGTESGFIGTLKNLLSTMPTIQPEKAQLSQQGTTSDLISRQAAIEAANKIIERDTSGSNDVVNAMTAWSEYIRALPTIQPEPQWIPVSERLPEKGGEYLVSVHHTIGAISVFHPEKDTYVDDVAIMKYYGKFPSTVRAWMPLPEAYKPNK